MDPAQETMYTLSTGRSLRIVGYSKDRDGVIHYHLEVSYTTANGEPRTKFLMKRFNDFKMLHSFMTRTLKDHNESHGEDARKCCWCWNANLPQLPAYDILSRFRRSDPSLINHRRAVLEQILEAIEACSLFRSSDKYLQFLEMEFLSRVPGSRYLSLKELSEKEAQESHSLHMKILRKPFLELLSPWATQGEGTTEIETLLQKRKIWAESPPPHLHPNKMFRPSLQMTNDVFEGRGRMSIEGDVANERDGIMDLPPLANTAQC